MNENCHLFSNFALHLRVYLSLIGSVALLAPHLAVHYCPSKLRSNFYHDRSLILACGHILILADDPFRQFQNEKGKSDSRRL